jgi:hypothetical protein
MEQENNIFRYSGRIIGLKYIKRVKYIHVEKICLNGWIFRDGKYSIYLKCPLLKIFGVRKFSDLIGKYIYWDQPEFRPLDNKVLSREDHPINITLMPEYDEKDYYKLTIEEKSND